jgi:Predicted transcriptional regulators
MNEYALNDAPALLNRAAAAGWKTPTAAAPAAGDIWLLTWNRQAQGVVLITKVEDDYVLGMPITFGTEHASELEAILPETVLGSPATLWFNAETGLGLFLLHRRVLPAAVGTELLTEYRRAGHLGVTPQFTIGARPYNEAADLRDELLSQYQSLCFLDWPEPVLGEANLDAAVIEELGLNGEEFAKRSGVEPQLAFEMWTGERLANLEVAANLAEILAVPVEELFTVSHDRAVHLLGSPAFKERITLVGAETGEDERTVRNRVRSSYALAARTDVVAGREEAALIEALEALRPKPEL